LNNWETLFAPVLAKGRQVREGQALLGNAIINAIEHGGSLLGEAGTGTGKSFATLIPIISKVIEAKKENKRYRGVVSTETNTLLAQLVDKDLPFLAKLYPGFEYRKLMGRSNYLCLNVAKQSAKGDLQLDMLVKKLEMRKDSIGDGEKADVERVLNRKLTKDEWESIAGSSKFCPENQCSSDECFTAKARTKALEADIVITNHALLATDTEMKAGDAQFSEGLLGTINCLVVDEGHKLEPVLVDQWTKRLSDWELREMSASVNEGIYNARPNFTDTDGVADQAGQALAGLEDMLKNILRFFVKLAEKRGEEWDGYSEALSEKLLSSSDSSTLLTLMAEYEVENPKRIEAAMLAMINANDYLKKALEAAETLGTKSVKRKIRKGITASKNLLEILGIMSNALQTKEGIVNRFGTFGCIVDGWKRFNGEPGLTIRLVPLDVSARARFIWEGVKTPVLLSATLTDLTDPSNPFRYARECVAFPPGKEIRVESPFDLKTQQLIYVTAGQDEPADVKGAQFSFNELLRLVEASKGRALVLFTSRKELDWAASQARFAQAQGLFPYRILVQEKDSDKAQLAADFKEDVHSVLFATKSFFTGFDAPGETLSMVAICKFPLPRYSVECRQQIAHWRSRGFSNWYTRAALTDLEQAFGRLVRSDDCRGVLALLDQRAMDSKSNVFKTAHLGLTSVGSPITQDINQVSAFFN
jgi:ATP-dependent DNA helicase DinG